MYKTILRILLKFSVEVYLWRGLIYVVDLVNIEI